MPLFTVIIPVYNRPDLVVDTIESVLNQTFQDREVIIIDDGSTDSTPQVLQRYADRVKLIRQENQGLGAARNHALEAAQGEYVVFLDSDDLLLPWTLQRFSEVIESHRRPSIILGAVKSFTDQSTVSRISNAPPQIQSYTDYLASYKNAPWLAPSSTAVRTEVIRNAGGFFIHRFTHEENDAWLRICNSPGFVQIDAPVCCARREHGGNISAFSMKNVEGAVYLLDAERKENYPGGNARKRQRRGLIAIHIRPVSLSCIFQNQPKWAWLLYLRTFMWNLSLFRFRYLLGFPLLAFRQKFTNRSKRSNS